MLWSDAYSTTDPSTSTGVSRPRMDSRAVSGARFVRLFRDTDDQNFVAVHLDFDAKDAATVFLERLRSQVWSQPELLGDLMTAPPTAKILEEVSREGQSAG